MMVYRPSWLATAAAEVFSQQHINKERNHLKTLSERFGKELWRYVHEHLPHLYMTHEKDLHGQDVGLFNVFNEREFKRTVLFPIMRTHSQVLLKSLKAELNAKAKIAGVPSIFIKYHFKPSNNERSHGYTWEEKQSLGDLIKNVLSQSS